MEDAGYRHPSLVVEDTVSDVITRGEGAAGLIETLIRSTRRFVTRNAGPGIGSRKKLEIALRLT